MPTRISGMATGMDTDALVKQLMQAKRVPIDKMKQQQTKLEWQRDSFRDVNTMLSQLRDAASKMRYTSTLNVKKTSTSNDAAVLASGTSDATNGSYAMNVNNLAATAQLRGGVLGISSDTSQSLTSSTLSITVAGEKGSKTVTIAQNSTIKDVVSAINAQTSATGVKVAYDSVSDRMAVNSSNTGSQAFFSLSGGDSAADDFLTNTLKLGAQAANTVVTGTKTYSSINSVINSSLATTEKFTVNGKELTINASTTVADLNDQLSKAGLATPVSMSLDSNGKIRLESSGAVTLGDVSGGMAELGLSGAVTTPATSISGRGIDASVDFNGVAGLKFHTNNINVSGINMTLKDKTVAPFTVTVSSDLDASVASIKGFVDKYNEVLGKLYDKIHEPSNRSYLPLTDDQRADMKDDEIKQWETKAKEGLLRSDSTLNSIYNSLRSSVGSPVSGVGATEFSLLSDVGITTGQYYEHGKLTINEDALRQALTDRPDEVMNLFTKLGTRDATTGRLVNPSEAGMGQRLADLLDASMKNIADKAGSALNLKDISIIGRQIDSYKDRISKANDKLAGYEQKYYSQFAKLESAMEKANSQRNYWASMSGASTN